jgi:gluconolactonase
MDAFEILDDRFRAYIQLNAPLVKLGEGFDWLEGPVWFADRNCLLFSDLPSDRIMRWTAAGGISLFRGPSGYANGHTRDRQGRLIGCSHRHRCITRTEIDGRVTVLVDRFQGKRLNSPNDVVCKSDGTIWFSDPLYGIETYYEGGKQTSELPPAVYCLSADGQDLRVAASDFAGPNGLAFSPDERRLYVCETGPIFAPDPARFIRVFDVGDDGRLTNGRHFHTISPGYADGIRVDRDGNVWSSAADGVHCLSPEGEKLGVIKTPFKVSNLTFGGRDGAQVFICASHTLFSIFTNQRGAQWP